MSIYRNLVSGVRKFPVFKSPKQAQINAFYNYVCKLWVCGCKGSEKFAGVQEKSHFLVIFYSANQRRALNRCQILESRDSRDGNPSSGGQVTGHRESIGWLLSGNQMVSEWFRERKEKDAGRRQEKDKRKIGGRCGILRLTTRLSYVYLTYMLRICYVYPT